MAVAGYWMRVSAHSTARKLMPLRKKLPATPTRAIAYPPSVGPRMRDMLNCAELSAMALVRSSRGTSLGTSA